MLVIIVDDDEGILEMVGKMLERSGIKSIKAKSATDFYSILRKLYKKNRLPDLVLLDIMMPDITGDEVLENMKKYKLTKSIPVVVMTAVFSSFQKFQEDKELEYDGLITKPFSKDELMEEIYRAKGML